MEKSPDWIFEEGPKYSELEAAEIAKLRQERKHLLIDIRNTMLLMLVIVMILGLYVYGNHNTFEWESYLLIMAIGTVIWSNNSFTAFWGICWDLWGKKKIEGLGVILECRFVESSKYSPRYFLLKVKMYRKRKLKIPFYFREHRLESLKVGDRIYIVSTYPGNRLLDFYGSKKLNKGKQRKS